MTIYPYVDTSLSLSNCHFMRTDRNRFWTHP
jgi:hypothetical protein